MPAHRRRQPVDVLLELPRQPGLAHTRLAVDHDEARARGLLRRVEQLLDHPYLTVAPGQRRLEPVDSLPAAHLRDHRSRLPEPDRPGLALEQVLAGIRVRDRRGGQRAGALVDPYRPGVGHGLDPGSRVHRVAGHHAFRGGADRDGYLACDDADPYCQVTGAEVFAHRRDRLDELETGSYRTLGVVLVADRYAPHCHDGVTDELLDRPAVPADDRTTLREVPGQQLSDLLSVAGLGQRREPDQVGEQDGRDSTLGHRPVGCAAHPRCA